MDSVHSGPPRSFGSVPPGRYSERFPESSRFNSPSGDTALPQVPGRRFIRPAAVRPGNIRAPAPFPAPGGGIFPQPSAPQPSAPQPSAPERRRQSLQFPAPGTSPGPGRRHFSATFSPATFGPRAEASVPAISGSRHLTRPRAEAFFRNLRPRHPSRPLGRRQPRSAAMNSGQRVQRFSVRSHSSRACAPTEGCSLSMSRR